jgi:hypothetical protein
VATFLKGSYLTIEEYRAAPTALATNNLVPGGDQAAQDNELAAIIKRASTFLDNTARQKLYATQATQNEQVRIKDGYFVLRAYQDRVKSIDAFSWGATPSSLTAAATPIPTSSYFVEENRVLFITGAPGVRWVGSLNMLATPISGSVWASWMYTAGFFTTRLTAPAAIGATTVTVEDPTGIQPGGYVRLVDGGQVADAQVSPAYVPGSAAVALFAALAEAFPAGAGFTEVPDDLKEACVLATSHYVKDRKSGGFVMAGQSATVDQTTDAQLGPDLERARQLALRYERITP